MDISKIYKLLKIIQTQDYMSALVQHGVAASVEHSGMLNSLKSIKFQTILDIGANRGQFSLAARKSFPEAKIIAFEPLKEAVDVFRRVFLSDSHICLYEMAVGREEKEMPIHVSKADDSSSLLPITTLQNDLFPGTAEKTIRSVQVKPLSSILSKDEIISPALLKMDVQGYEKEALQGCLSLLDSFLYIYVECSFVELYAGQALASEVISYLDQSGFNLCGIYNLSYDKKGRAIQGDFLFTNDLVRHNQCVS